MSGADDSMLNLQRPSKRRYGTCSSVTILNWFACCATAIIVMRRIVVEQGARVDALSA